jgi:signal transduction histidine kinase
MRSRNRKADGVAAKPSRATSREDDLAAELQARTAERDEALAQQNASAALLQVINSSHGDLAPVFEAMLDTALRLCDAGHGSLVTCDGARLHWAAYRGHRAFTEWLRGQASVFHAEPGTIVARMMVSGENVIQVTDVADEGQYMAARYRRALIDFGGFRTLLGVALRKDERLLGVIYVIRQEVRPFSDKQIALLQNFAAQAAISLENARLYSDLVHENRDRRKAEEALRASEASLNEAQQISHTGSWRWNVGTGEVSSSAELLRIFAFDPTTQPSYATFMERVHADDRLSLEQMLNSAVRERRRFRHEYRIASPDGSVKHLQAVGHPAVKASGDIEFVGTVMDITERIRSEEALREAQMELARVARLTTMGELAASIAHEINQPLAAIATNGSACLRWLSRDEPDLDEARAATSRIVRDAGRAGDVIRGLRALATKSGPQVAELDINDVIRDVLALTRSELQRHGVALCTELSADTRQILGDRVQLQQVLLNLIMNGVDAMSAVTDRPRMLTITSQSIEPMGMRVTVEDTGTGLDPATADRIFDPFFTTKPQGMGMGLRICQSIIGAHGGGLSASQRHPHGAIFQFTVECAVDDSQSVGANAQR